MSFMNIDQDAGVSSQASSASLPGIIVSPPTVLDDSQPLNAGAFPQAPTAMLPPVVMSAPTQSGHLQLPNIQQHSSASSRGPRALLPADSKNPKNLACIHAIRQKERDSLKWVQDNVPRDIKQRYFIDKGITGPKLTRCISAMNDWVYAEQQQNAATEARVQELDGILEQSIAYTRFLEGLIQSNIADEGVSLEVLRQAAPTPVDYGELRDRLDGAFETSDGAAPAADDEAYEGYASFL